MAKFNEIFTKAQQFLMYQAYLDQILTEEELLNFTLLEDQAREVLAVFSRGLLVIEPNVDLDQFKHEFYPKNQLQVKNISPTELSLTAGTKNFILTTEKPTDTVKLAEDLAYLLK